MSMLVFRAAVFPLLLAASSSVSAEPLSGQATQLYQRAAREADVGGLQPETMATRDGRSYFLVWEPQAIKGRPHRWIVSLHGSNGFATKDLSIWEPHLQGRKLGIISLQWWLGSGDRTADYYSPFDIYRELDTLMRRIGIKPGEAMLEGFSRGSANIYAVAALDHNKGGRYFSLVVANSGGAAMDYPPTQAVDAGRFGAMPYSGMRWVTVCGERDPNPERDGCPAMRRTGDWLKKQGGEVVFAVEDGREGHGAFHRNPQNARRVLDWFEQNP